MANFKIMELTKDNQEKYINQIDILEQKVLKNMENNGQKGQLFPTGKNDILQYASSKENTVLIAINESDEVVATTYITQGQMPFTYNDITKYFKYGENYNNYVKSLYHNKQEYLLDMLKAYELKLDAFKYAKNMVLAESSKDSILDFLREELKKTENHFHEKSILRENLNKYMSQYIEQMDNKDYFKKIYERFYWTTKKDIFREFGKEYSKEKVENISDNYLQNEYSEIIESGPLKILEIQNSNLNKYFNANTSNSIEIDTYITDPDKRDRGLAKILVYEGIKKHIKQFFNNDKNSDIYLCSTLHRENLSSKYVSEFFGLKDSIYVNRRDGRNREVHIKKIERNQYLNYINDMGKEIAVLYNYNPGQLLVTNEDIKAILLKQLQYEKNELERLNNAKNLGKFTRKQYYIESKSEKIKRLLAKYESLEHNKEKGDR